MDKQQNAVQTKVTQRLRQHDLEGIIELDDSALKKLKEVGSKGLVVVDEYLGRGVVKALLGRKAKVTSREMARFEPFIDEYTDPLITHIPMRIGNREDIRKQLAKRTAQEAWSYVKYLISNVPLVLDSIKQHKSYKDLRADRRKHADECISRGELPQYALQRMVRYEDWHERGMASIAIPFVYDPLDREMKAVAHNLASFVSQHSEKYGEIKVRKYNLTNSYFIESSKSEDTWEMPELMYRVWKHPIQPPYTTFIGGRVLISVDKPDSIIRQILGDYAKSLRAAPAKLKK